jgi:hypothetical protein
VYIARDAAEHRARRAPRRVRPSPLPLAEPAPVDGRAVTRSGRRAADAILGRR